MSFEAAALLEPAAVALHAARRLDLHGVRNAAVIGNGIIGRLAARWFEIYGVANVELLGRDDRQGFAHYDACIDAVGSAEALARCIEAVRPGGQIVLAGNPDADFCLGQKLYWQILRKQIALRGSWNSRYPADWQRVIEHAGKLWLDGLISDRCSLGELGKAADMVRNRKSGRYCKVVAAV
ncbi:MAG: zinc-binding dehydrogenase [Fibromonadales bacterium]|nr:zinc-binding dehydrogenase [Fibromonadales bacterium]